jgi:hypothetical protein
MQRIMGCTVPHIFVHVIPDGLSPVTPSASEPLPLPWLEIWGRQDQRFELSFPDHSHETIALAASGSVHPDHRHAGTGLAG